jgi:hypothetical protein
MEDGRISVLPGICSPMISEWGRYEMESDNRPIATQKPPRLPISGLDLVTEIWQEFSRVLLIVQHVDFDEQ